MTNLTEQWKKGELEEGYYYIKGIKKYEGVDIHWTAYPVNPVEERCVKQILAPVPSYLQWNAMLESNDSLVQTINALKNRLVEVAEENAKIKELLEQASYYLIGYKNNDTLPERAFYEEEVSEFLEKIDEVLK